MKNKEKEIDDEPTKLMKEYKPKIPYHAKLKKDLMNEQFGMFLELFKQLHINLPFVKELSQMPKYANLLKELQLKRVTIGAIIDAKEGKLVLRIGDEEVTLKICDCMKHSLKQYDTCYFLDVVDIIVTISMQEIMHDDSFELYLVQGKEKRLRPSIEDPPLVFIRLLGS